MKLLNILIILLLVVASVEAKHKAISQIPDEDKFKIIESILLKEFQAGETKTVCLSIENIPKSMLAQFPKLKEITFTLITPDKFKESDCGLEYYYFGRFEKKGASTLVFFTNNYRNVSKNGRQYSYRRIKGKWQGKIVGFTLGNS